MVTATLALIGFFVALYLLLYKLGVVGDLACGGAGCVVVQSSRYAVFLGLPVPLYGVLGFVVLFILSMVGLQPTWLHRRSPSTVIALLSGVGVAFSAYLTYLEAVVIHAWCLWCVISACLIAAIFVISLLGVRFWSGDAIYPRPTPPSTHTSA